MTDAYLLSGLKVLDVGSWIAGPVAATMLADFGADVIKVEIPGAGDQYRILSGTQATPDADMNYMWQMDGRNKRSVALNLKTDEGMEVLRKLVAECDVYVTNQPFPLREAIGTTWEELKNINPRMIYASLTAYGEEGPDRNREGFDLVAYWARSGLMDLVRDSEAPPAQGLPGMGDHPSAVSLFAGIMTALLHRERTGEGSLVHTSLLANGLWSISCIAQAGFAGGSFARYREVKAGRGFARSLYRTRDDRWLQFTMVRGPEDFRKFLDVVGLTGLLEDEKFATPEARLQNGAALSHIVQDVMINHDSDEWLERFHAAGVNAARVGVVEETVTDEQIYINNMVVAPKDESMDIPHVINHPVNVDRVAQVGPTRAPEVGEHSVEVLAELGYAPETIARMKEKGVI